MSDNIQVAIKVRPLLKKEKDSKLARQWKIIKNSIQAIESQLEPFYFDHIFDENATNIDIFDKISKPIVDAALRGFNGTIFAYGQTSSGKTYTMLGDDKNPGVMVMAVQEIFKEIEKAADREFLIRVGYIEIYNEKVFDLLSKNKDREDLKVYETQTGEVNVNCTESIIRNEQEMLKYLYSGSKARRIGDTNLNERSSRSHAIFRIIIESRKCDNNDESAVQISHLNLVDLAGSERADQTGATGSRLKEGCHINKSLLSLGLVIKELSENDDKFINYRNSKLTRILQASLGGNALTAIICTINPTTVEESNSTLNFAMRAKTIRNKPKKNEVLSEAAMMKRLAKEIARLQTELEKEKRKNSQPGIMEIEKQIQDAVLKIVHSHSIEHEKQRRRTWCPSTTQHNTDVLKFDVYGCKGENLAGDEIDKYEPPSVKPPLLTPLITMRELKEQQPEDIWDDQFVTEFKCPDIIIEEEETVMQTPKKVEPSGQIRMTMTPTPTVRTRFKQLEAEYEELKAFNAYERDIELNEAREKILALERERHDYLDIIDSSFENQLKLKTAQGRCQELEQRISELIEKVDFLEIREEKLKIVSEECNRKTQSLLTTVRNMENLEFQYKQLQQNYQTREQELLATINEQKNQIDNLEKRMTQKPVSFDGKEVDETTTEKILDSDENAEKETNETGATALNAVFEDSSTKELKKAIENLKQQLHDHQNALNQKDAKLAQLDINLQCLLTKTEELEKENAQLSTQVLDNIYENDKLTAKLKELDDLEKKRQHNVPVPSFETMQCEWCGCSTRTTNTSFTTMDNSSEGELGKTTYGSNGSWMTPEEIADSIADEIVIRALQMGRSDGNEMYASCNQTGTTFKPLGSESLEEIICDMKEKLVQYENTNRELTTKLDEMSSHLNHLKSQNADYVKTAQTLELANGELEEQLSTTELQFAELDAETRKSGGATSGDEEIEILHDTIRKLENQNELAESEKTVATKVKSDLEAELATVRNQLEEFKTQNSELASILDESIQNFKDQVTKLQTELIKTRDEKEAADEKLSDAKKTNSEYAAEIDNRSQEISQLEERNADLISKLAHFEGLNKALEEKHAELETLQRTLKENYEKIATFEANDRSEIDLKLAWDKERENLETLLAEETYKNSELERRLQNIREEQTRHLDLIKTTQEDLAAREKENTALKQSNELLQRDYVDLQSALTTFKSTNVTMEADHQKLKQKLDELETERNGLFELNQKLSEEMATIKEENAELKEQFKDIKTEWKEEDRKHALEIIALNNEKTRLETSLEELKNDHEQLQLKNDEMSNKHSDLQAELERISIVDQDLREEYTALKESVVELHKRICQLDQERDELVECKKRMEEEFERRLKIECQSLDTDMTNIRSQNLLLTDQIESLQLEKDQLQALLNSHVGRTKDIERDLKFLEEKFISGNEKLRCFERSNEELEEKLERQTREYEETKIRTNQLSATVADLESKLNQATEERERLENDREKIIIAHREQFEVATSKVTQIKNELEIQMHQISKYRLENGEMKEYIVARDAEILELTQQIEAKDSEHLAFKDVFEKEKEELVKQLHEMRKMHIYKIKQYQQEIQNLKGNRNAESDEKNERIGDYWNRILQSPDGMDGEKQRIIKTLLGENDELRQKNQTLTAELQESRKLLQRDRKSKRHSGHDEKRSLQWNDSRDIGVMTMPTGNLCSCEQLNKELIEIKKALKIKDCQINTLIMESKHNPLKEEYESLKRSIEEEEAEKKELRKELCKLKLKISELYKETKRCDQCLRRSMTVFVNQFSQTAFGAEEQNANSDGVNGISNSKVETTEHLKLQNKYETLKRLCQLRNHRIQELENQISKEKENETNNGQIVNHMGNESSIDLLSKELFIIKKKYEEARYVCNYREKRIRDLETQLEQTKHHP